MYRCCTQARSNDALAAATAARRCPSSSGQRCALGAFAQCFGAARMALEAASAAVRARSGHAPPVRSHLATLAPQQLARAAARPMPAYMPAVGSSKTSTRQSSRILHVSTSSKSRWDDARGLSRCHDSFHPLGERGIAGQHCTGIRCEGGQNSARLTDGISLDGIGACRKKESARRSLHRQLTGGL